MEYEEKCDIWSIRVMMYIMLTRKPPFNDSKDERILYVL
jgi:serine/threonine protein kinase